MIIGIDEVGRGPWAGPLVACAVALDADIKGLKDSKLLTPNRRQTIALVIKQKSLAIGLGWVSASKIDELGLNRATTLAMKMALEQIDYQNHKIIIDGNINYLSEIADASTMVGADKKIPAVSAASIIAKVSRDNYMKNISGLFSNYGFEKHKGYGTQLHKLGLAKYGVSKIHRKSFKPIQRI